MQRTEAQCYNELGQCYLLQGAKSGKKDDLREALLAFLWNVVLHSRLRAEYTEALFNAAVCFEKLGERPRAAELRNELLKSFPESPQARKLGAASPAKSPEPRKESGK
jgi:tetratricopeptide (TPR) repeat protein